MHGRSGCRGRSPQSLERQSGREVTNGGVEVELMTTSMLKSGDVEDEFAPYAPKENSVEAESEH